MKNPVESKTKKKPKVSLKTIELKKAKLKRMEILVTRQLNTAHKQVKHLAVEQSKLKELAKKTENADYFSRLEQKIVDYDEAINILKKSIIYLI